MQRLRAVLIASLLVTAAVACGSDGDADGDADGADAPSPTSVASVPDGPLPLLEAVEQTILGQPIDYPDGTAQITSTVLTLQPGEETGWHHHDTPLYAHILDGSITVDYGDEGERVYEAGDTLMEAIGTSHNGRTNGDEPARILVVNLGSDTAENTVMDDA